MKGLTHKLAGKVDGLAALVLGIQLVVLSPAVFAQSVNDRVIHLEDKVQELDRRQGAVEALQIEKRLTSIETMLKFGNYLNWGSTGGITVLLGHTYWMRRKRRKDDQD